MSLVNTVSVGNTVIIIIIIIIIIWCVMSGRAADHSPHSSVAVMEE